MHSGSSQKWLISVLESCVHRAELAQLKAEVKSRNEAGTADRQTRTEGCGEPQSGATHTDRSRTDISRHEAATAEQAEKIC